MASSSPQPPSDKQIQALFDQIAPVYDVLNGWLSLGQHSVWKQMAVDWANPAPGTTCLDVCCGSGDLAYRMARRVGPNGVVVGVDFSPQQLAIARQRQVKHWSALPSAPIVWTEANALSLPYEDNFFDAITMGYGLRNVVDIPLSLQELHRVLRPGATAAVLDFHRPETAAMQWVQQLYLDYLVVPVAQQFGLKTEYAYISDSLNRFPSGRQQIILAHEAGFSSAVHYTLVGGMMGILVATKARKQT